MSSSYISTSVHVPPVPASTSTLERYAAFLARTRCSSSVQQYMNIIRIIHLEFGQINPLQNNWHVKAVVQGIKRGKGTKCNSKLPILPQHLLKIRNNLNLNDTDDLQLWAALLVAFFCLLRVSNIAIAHNIKHVIKREDINISPQGISLALKHSKTIQFQEKCHTIVLPYLPHHPLCPTTAITRFLARTSACTKDTCIFSIPKNSEIVPLTASAFRHNLEKHMKAIVKDSSSFSTHSLRRGGATWLMSVGTPLASIRIIGDWASDAVYRYLSPDTHSKFLAMQVACKHLPS